EKILEEPVHAKLLDALLKANDDNAQQVHYFYCLRLLHEGWTKEQKASLLTWYDSTRTWSGGHSFHPFLENILKDLNPAFTKEDRTAVLAKALEMPRASLAILRMTPDDQLPPAAELDELRSKLKGAKPMQLEIVGAIGRAGTPEAQAILRKMCDS